MRKINIHEARTHLSRLVDEAAAGEAFVIAKAGKPMVKVVALDPASRGKPHRFGFLKGQIKVPDDFDRLGEDAIAELFGAPK